MSASALDTPDLATLVTQFFGRHLPAERHVSPHTVAAYRDTFKLFLPFAARLTRYPLAQLSIEGLTADVVLQFLGHLETDRHNTVRTRNARLAALHAFYRYVNESEPPLALLCQHVLRIPLKKTVQPVLGSLSEAEVAHLLQQVDRHTTDGERDYLLLALLYDTGARIQEVLDLTPAQRFEYIRHGTLSLFAAFEITTGRVAGQPSARHTSGEFLRFLDELVGAYRRTKEIHIILDHHSAHKTPAVAEWRVAHPNVQFHFTPTYSSWLNQVELWFAKISREMIRRGVFTSVPDLAKKLLQYIKLYNKTCRPFHWTYADPTHRIPAIKT